MAKDLQTDPDTIWLAIESYNTFIDGAPLFVAKGDRPATARTQPARHPQWWLEDGSTATHVARARAKAGPRRN